MKLKTLILAGLILLTATGCGEDINTTEQNTTDDTVESTISQTEGTTDNAEGTEAQPEGTTSEEEGHITRDRMNEIRAELPTLLGDRPTYSQAGLEKYLRDELGWTLEEASFAAYGAGVVDFIECANIKAQEYLDSDKGYSLYELKEVLMAQDLFLAEDLLQLDIILEGVDWNQQALNRANTLIKEASFQYDEEGLRMVLTKFEFDAEAIDYAIENCSLDRA